MVQLYLAFTTSWQILLYRKHKFSRLALNFMNSNKEINQLMKNKNGCLIFSKNRVQQIYSIENCRQILPNLAKFSLTLGYHQVIPSPCLVVTNWGSLVICQVYGYRLKRHILNQESESSWITQTITHWNFK